MVFDGQNFLVFCFYRKQAELLGEQESFEVDMAFKRVRNKGINEIVLAKFFQKLRRGMYKNWI